MENVVGIFTGKDLNWMMNEGGSGYWLAKSDRIGNANYAIFMRNHRETWAIKNDGTEHGQAFMVGKIAGCIKTDKYKGRKIIELSEIALLPDDSKFKKAWKKLTDGQRYPVAYLNTKDLLEKLSLDLSVLDWKPFAQNIKMEQNNLNLGNAVENDNKDLATVVEGAKNMISELTAIPIDKITIQISL